MPRPKKTAAEMESMRSQILDTALAILQAEGAEAITSRAIADQMGLAHMSLFTYFENQAAILDALREREMARWRARQLAFVQRAQSEDITRVVHDLLAFYIGFARENPHLFRLAWVMPESAGERREEENRQRRQETVGHMAHLLKIGMEQGVFQSRDPFLAAGVVLGIVNMPYLLYYSGKLVDPLLRDRMVEEVVSAVFSYLTGPSLHITEEA